MTDLAVRPVPEPALPAPPLRLPPVWPRRTAAAVALLLGVVDLVLAALREPLVRLGPLGVDWAIGTVVGARYLLLVAGVTLVVVTRGLLHGKRNAWLLAIVAAAASVPAHHLKRADAVGLVVAITAVVVLAVLARHFRARSDPALARRGVQVFLVGELTVFLYGVAGLYLLDENFRDSTSLGQSILEAARLLFLLPTATIEPVTRHGHWFVDSVRVAALTVALVALARLVATVVSGPSHRADEAHVRRLLEAYATSGVAYFHLLDDKAWFFAADGRAFIGYKVVGSTAVVLAEPVGAPDAVGPCVTQFLELCALNGWTPAFHQVSEPGRELLEACGLRSLKIGEEAIVEVQTWSVDAREYKSLRSALRRCERAGCHVEELAKPIDDATMHELREVSDSWLDAGGHRERTFTLGRFDPAYLRDTTIVVVRDGTGRIVAFANLLPEYRSNDGNFDLMRRRPDSPNGVMEMLFVALIERFRAEGRTGMTLGLAPFSNITGDSLPDRALRLLYERGEQVFNFEGLRRFKDKWQPRWEPRYLCYRRDTELPKVAAAVTRAGELPDPRRPLGRLLGALRRYPFSFAAIFLTLWLMAVGQVSHMVWRQLMRHFGLNWHDLSHLQLWRLPTSQFIETKPGFVLANVALMFLVVPIAEWRLGSRRTIALFFLGDWCSTIPVLIGLRIAAGMGSHWAAVHAATRDGGVSAGAWALTAALAWSLPAGRPRRIAVGAVFAFLGTVLVVFHRLFDLQHFVSALAAIGLVTLWDRRAAARAAAEAASGETPASTEAVAAS